MSLLIPGCWHWLHGHEMRGFAWAIAILLTGPLILPAVVLWVLCALDAARLSRSS